MKQPKTVLIHVKPGLAKFLVLIRQGTLSTIGRKRAKEQK